MRRRVLHSSVSRGCRFGTI